MRNNGFHSVDLMRSQNLKKKPELDFKYKKLKLHLVSALQHILARYALPDASNEIVCAQSSGHKLKLACGHYMNWR